MKLSVVSRDDRVVRLACEGKLAPLPGTVPPNPLGDLLGTPRPGQAVLLDLSRANYINSSGISWLIQAHKQVDDGGGQLVLHSLSPQVRRALELVRLNGVFKVAADEPAALAHLTR